MQYISDSYMQNRIRWNSIIEHLPTQLMLFNRDGEIIYQNYPFDLWDTPRHGDLKLSRLLGETTCNELVVAARDACDTMRTAQVDIEITDRYGNDRRYRVCIFPYSVSEVFTIWIDTDNGGEFDSAFLEEKIRLEQTIRLRREFLSILSHEVKTPLTSIIGITDILQQMDGPDSLAECVEVLRKSVMRLEEILCNIFDASRKNWNEVVIHQTVFSVRELSKRLLYQKSDLAAERYLKLDFTVSAELPLQIRGDETRLWQICSGIIDSAVTATSGGVVHLSFLPLHQPDGRLVLQILLEAEGDEKTNDIRTSAPGRTDASSEPSDPFSLGMPLVNYLVSAMNGKISVAGNGHGTTLISIEIPVDYADAPPEM